MRLCIAALLAFMSPAVLAYTAVELADRNVAAKGGLDRLHAIRSLRLTGRLQVTGDPTRMDTVMLVRRPQSIRYEVQLQGLTQVQAFDGSEAWQINPFEGRKDPEKLSADDAKGLAEDAADFDGVLVDYRAKGYTLDYLGTEDVDGTAAYKLRVTRRNGDVTTVYLDPDQFLEIRTVNRRIEHGVPSETVTDYGDYERVDGVYFPFAQSSGPRGSSERQNVQYDRAEANVVADEASFHVPAAPAHVAEGK
jgi:hypothetical protein